VELWPLNRLVVYERNPRKNEQAVNRMVTVIQQFGFQVPILARSGGGIVDGHLRIKAAKRLGIHEVPVILCHEWTPVQVNKEKRNP
jgi:ParB-like chromosome segregation protein Spo0J